MSAKLSYTIKGPPNIPAKEWGHMLRAHLTVEDWGQIHRHMQAIENVLARKTSTPKHMSLEVQL